mgnify:CR=1 FL=1
MYKLLKDKNNEFQCEIKLEGTSSSNAKVRLFLEGDGCEYSFVGHISGERCVVPMGKLKKFENLLKSGMIRLEVVADDTLFTPYESVYELDESKKVTVEVINQDKQEKKPVVEVKVKQESVKKVSSKPSPLQELKQYFKNNTKFNGTLQSLKEVMKNIDHKNYFNDFCEYYSINKKQVVSELLTKL